MHIGVLRKLPFAMDSSDPVGCPVPDSSPSNQVAPLLRLMAPSIFLASFRTISSYSEVAGADLPIQPDLLFTLDISRPLDQ